MRGVGCCILALGWNHPCNGISLRVWFFKWQSGISQNLTSHYRQTVHLKKKKKKHLLQNRSSWWPKEDRLHWRWRNTCDGNNSHSIMNKSHLLHLAVIRICPAREKDHQWGTLQAFLTSMLNSALSQISFLCSDNEIPFCPQQITSLRTLCKFLPFLFLVNYISIIVWVGKLIIGVIAVKYNQWNVKTHISAAPPLYSRVEI